MLSHLFGASSRLPRQVAPWMAVLGLALVTTTAPVVCPAAKASAMVAARGPQHIYVYNSQNVLVDVTDTLEIGEDFYWHITVDEVSIPVVINNQNGHVYDLASNPIGYVGP